MTATRRTLAGLCLAALLAGCLSRAPEEAPFTPPSPQVRIELRDVLDAPEPGSIEAADAEGKRYRLAARPLLDTGDVLGARKETDIHGMPVVLLRFSADAGARLQRDTQSRLGRQVAFVVDGQVVMAPNVAGPFGDSVMITGLAGQEGQQALFERITRSGAH
ncbi:SecDF P1 head subdomain-containing protein [Luteimonas aquatica]|uniref:SecDF P1 head subdomain-containing protein n=1 Tax=Luteimonas aquatica TaxID=450364 RepID=UPI001F592C4D|nr:hypothetical protein [Luteimonas aquatica]